MASEGILSSTVTDWSKCSICQVCYILCDYFGSFCLLFENHVHYIKLVSATAWQSLVFSAKQRRKRSGTYWIYVLDVLKPWNGTSNPLFVSDLAKRQKPSFTPNIPSTKTWHVHWRMLFEIWSCYKKKRVKVVWTNVLLQRFNRQISTKNIWVFFLGIPGRIFPLLGSKIHEID